MEAVKITLDNEDVELIKMTREGFNRLAGEVNMLSYLRATYPEVDELYKNTTKEELDKFILNKINGE